MSRSRRTRPVDVAAVVLAALLTRGGRSRTRPADPPAGPDPAVEQAMLRAGSAQAWATWAGVVVALVAVVVSGLAWWGQRDLNRDQQTVNENQIKLNEYLLQRAPRVYAARVAVWAVRGRETSSVRTPGLDVSVQNRAPVPLRNVAISAVLDGPDGQKASRDLGDVLPCTLLTFRLSPPPGRDFKPGTNDWLGYGGLTLAFSETDRSWKLEPTQLTTQPPAPPEAESLLIPEKPTGTSLSDCSESS